MDTDAAKALAERVFSYAVPTPVSQVAEALLDALAEVAKLEHSLSDAMEQIAAIQGSNTVYMDRVRSLEGLVLEGGLGLNEKQAKIVELQARVEALEAEKVAWDTDEAAMEANAANINEDRQMLHSRIRDLEAAQTPKPMSDAARKDGARQRVWVTTKGGSSAWFDARYLDGYWRESRIEHLNDGFIEKVGRALHPSMFIPPTPLPEQSGEVASEAAQND